MVIKDAIDSLPTYTLRRELALVENNLSNQHGRDQEPHGDNDNPVNDAHLASPSGVR